MFVSAGLQGSASPRPSRNTSKQLSGTAEKQGTAVGHSQQNRNNNGILE